MIRTAATWPLWSLPRTAITLLISAEVASVLIPWADSVPITRPELGLSALLASLSIAYSALTVRWERARRALRKDRSPNVCPNLLATWAFPAAIVLPLRLAAVVLIIAAVAEWPARNIAGQASPYRYVYSSAGAILAAAAASGCARLPLPYWSYLALAAAVYIFIGMATVAMAMISVGQLSDLKVCMLPRTYRLEIYTIAIAIAEIQFWRDGVPLIWLSLPAAIAIQRWALRSALRVADDAGSRPMTEKAWLAVAREVTSACATASILRVDTTDPIAVGALARMQAGCDAIGTVGRSGLAILLADCPGANADSLAARLRSALNLSDIRANVAVAAKPRDGQSLVDLLAVSEAELITREAATRPAKSLWPEA